MSTSERHEGRVSSSVAGLLSGGPTRGTVHSLFENSFNVALGDVLLNVQSLEGQLAAFGTTLDVATVHKLIAVLKVGDLVRASGQRLRFYPTYGDPVAIDLGALPVKDLSVPAGAMTADHNDTLREAIGELELESRLGIGIDAAFRTQESALAASDPSAEDIRAAYTYLVGRGTGLTPSGDDLVTGYSFWLMARGGMEVDPELVALMDGRTTEISVSFLKMLARGFTSEYYRDLCTALERDARENLDRILRRITRIGHSSGRDSLYGIWLATRRMANAPPGGTAGND